MKIRPNADFAFSFLTDMIQPTLQSSRTVFIIVAPSGAGKSSLVNALLSQDPDLRLSVSHTTRAPRLGEIDGQHYHFVDLPTFEGLCEQGVFLETAEVHGHYYGTSRDAIESCRRQGHDVVLEIDWQGAQQIRRTFTGAVSVFILPPSFDALQSRLQKRGQDTPNVIARRLLAAGGEIAHANECDYVVINDVFDHALEALKAIVAAARFRFTAQQVRHAELFAELGIHG